jgi:hypothetical protein
VRDFQLQGLTTEEMAEKSKIVNVFPADHTANRDQTQALSWIRRQYQLAAEAVLKERK